MAIATRWPTDATPQAAVVRTSSWRQDRGPRGRSHLDVVVDWDLLPLGWPILSWLEKWARRSTCSRSSSDATTACAPPSRVEPAQGAVEPGRNGMTCDRRSAEDPALARPSSTLASSRRASTSSRRSGGPSRGRSEPCEKDRRAQPCRGSQTRDQPQLEESQRVASSTGGQAFHVGIGDRLYTGIGDQLHRECAHPCPNPQSTKCVRMDRIRVDSQVRSVALLIRCPYCREPLRHWLLASLSRVRACSWCALVSGLSKCRPSSRARVWAMP